MRNLKNQEVHAVHHGRWELRHPAEIVNAHHREVAYVEMKRALAENIRARRLKHKLTQSQLAKLVESSQSRVAKMESADYSVSLDLLIRVLLLLGSTPQEVARILAMKGHHAA